MVIMSSGDIEEIRRRRMIELRKHLGEEQQKSGQQKALQTQKDAVLKQVLTYEARQRLNRLKMVKPEFVEQIELYLIQIAQTGKVRLPIADRQLKQILLQLQPSRKEITFRRV